MDNDVAKIIPFTTPIQNTGVIECTPIPTGNNKPQNTGVVGHSQPVVNAGVTKSPEMVPQNNEDGNNFETNPENDNDMSESESENDSESDKTPHHGA